MPPIAVVTPNETLPERADVVIIGAGIVGITTALELSERGLSVVVVEKGEVACEQSGRNWGWCRQMGRDPREIPLIRVALEKWRGMNARIGADTGFAQCGIVYLCGDDAQFAARENWYQTVAVSNKLSSKLVGPREVAKLVPGAVKNFKGALYTTDDGRAEPFIAVPAMARALQARGGLIFTACAARGIETSAGRASAVVTEKGVIMTATVVVAGGYWSRRFLGNLGVRFPQVGVVNSVMRTAPRNTGITHSFSGGKFSVRKRQDGGFTIGHQLLSVADLTPSHFRQYLAFRPLLKLDRAGVRLRFGKRFFRESWLAKRWPLDRMSPFEKMRILDPAPVHAILDEALDDLQETFPAFQGLQSAERWAGMIDATPDAVPVIDAIGKIPGLFVASGFSGHGFGLGPGAGLLMAELITGDTPCVDPAPYRLGRFRGLSWPKPVAGL